MVKKLIKKHEEQIKYVVVGGWNTVFGFFAFIALYYSLNRIIHYTIILTASYIVSITNAYLCYKFLVFKTKGNYFREYFRFYLVYGVAYLINLGLLPVAVELFKIKVVIAQILIMLITILISYLGHKNFTFKPSSIEF